MKNPELARLLTQGIKSIASRQNRKVSAIQDELAVRCAQAVGSAQLSGHAVQKWRQEGYLPREEYIEVIARACVIEGGMERRWLGAMLHQARYYDRQHLLDELCPEQGLVLPRKDDIQNNLPRRSGEFIGRQEETVAVIEGLTSRWPLVAIEGMGGIGKTTLAVEAAYACLPNGEAKLENPFEACVFIAAKERPVVLNDLLDTIARVLNYPYIIQQISPDQKPVEVDRLLRGRRVLIVADDFENVTDMALIEYLQRIPEPSKALITTRYDQLRRVWDIPLRGLAATEALELIRRHAARLGLTTVITANDETLKPLVDVTEGNPYAIETALGYLKYGQLALDSLVNALYEAGQDVEEIFAHIFKRAWEILGQHAQHILMAMHFFVESAGKGAIGATAEVEGYYLDKAIAQLAGMSLLEVSSALKETEQRYRIHPLTLAFAGAKLREVPQWEQEARQRWITHFRNFAAANGGDDWDNWRQYEDIVSELPNLLAACHWALDNDIGDSAFAMYDDVNNVLFIRGMWEENLRLTGKAALVAERSKNLRMLSRWLCDCGWVRTWRGELAEALELLTEAQALAEVEGSTEVHHNVLQSLGALQTRMGNYQQAERLLQQALSLALQRQNDREVVGDWYYLGCLAFKHGDYDRAAERFGKVMKRGREINWARAYAYACNWLADVEIRRHNYVQAHQLLEEGIIVAQNFRDQRRIAYFNRSFALLEEAEGNREAAQRFAHEAQDLFTRLGMRQEIEEMIQVPLRIGAG